MLRGRSLKLKKKTEGDTSDEEGTKIPKSPALSGLKTLFRTRSLTESKLKRHHWRNNQKNGKTTVEQTENYCEDFHDQDSKTEDEYGDVFSLEPQFVGRSLAKVVAAEVRGSAEKKRLAVLNKGMSFEEKSHVTRDLKTPNEVWTQILSEQTCYDAILQSGKVIVLDSLLTLRHAFKAFRENLCQSTLIWDSQKKSYLGIMTESDFVTLLSDLSAGDSDSSPDTITISQWLANLPRDGYSFLEIDATQSLLETAQDLCRSNFKYAVIFQPDSYDLLAFLTLKDILRFLLEKTHYFLFPDWTRKSIDSLFNVQDLVCPSVQVSQSLIDVCQLFSANPRNSSVLVHSAKGSLISQITVRDITNLIESRTDVNSNNSRAIYQDLLSAKVSDAFSITLPMTDSEDISSKMEESENDTDDSPKDEVFTRNQYSPIRRLKSHEPRRFAQLLERTDSSESNHSSNRHVHGETSFKIGTPPQHKSQPKLNQLCSELSNAESAKLVQITCYQSDLTAILLRKIVVQENDDSIIILNSKTFSPMGFISTKDLVKVILNNLTFAETEIIHL